MRIASSIRALLRLSIRYSTNEEWLRNAATINIRQTPVRTGEQQ
jgi:hypothetical protein